MRKTISVLLCAVMTLCLLSACGNKQSAEELAALDLMTQVIAGDLSVLETCTGYEQLPTDFDIFEDTVKTVRAKTVIQTLEVTENEDGSKNVILGADAPDLLTAYNTISVNWLTKALSDPTLTDADIETGILTDLASDETLANWRIELLVTANEDETFTIDVTKAMASIEAVYTCNLTTILE